MHSPPQRRRVNGSFVAYACPMLAACLMFAAGCNNLATSVENSSATQAAASKQGTPNEANEKTSQPEQSIDVPKMFEVDAAGLLASVLSEQELNDGWVNLFDGQSLFGWLIVGKANWRVEEGIIKVDRGEPSFLCTNLTLADFELTVDFRCDATTNSGIFLRTQPSPQDVTLDCFELNIAPPDDPFPTGSLVQRKKLEPADLGTFNSSQWHTYLVRMLGDQVTISLDGKQVLTYTDDSKLKHGHVALQHKSGRVEFKRLCVRPLNSKSLKLDKRWEEDWLLSAKEGATFDVLPTAAGLRLSGGLGQLQSKADWGDFILQATYQLAAPEVNSGIFFRCMRDQMLEGYECQLNHAIIDNDPLRPTDGGAGAIFRRAPARIVVGDASKPTHVTIIASGPQFTTWVNGLQVVDFIDTRPTHENARKGLRVAPGPISLQGHDPTTKALFSSIKITAVE